VLDLRHNLEPLTDTLLDNIKKAPNLTTLRLPSHSLFSDHGLQKLEDSPCVKRLVVFSLESSVIWNALQSSRLRPKPLFTEEGLKSLLRSLKNLDELILDISSAVTSDLLLDDIVFNHLKRLSILRLSGPGLVDMKLISRLAKESLRFKTLDLEGSLIEIAGVPNLIKAIGSTLVEFRICVEDRKTQDNLLAGEQYFPHPLVRYSECSR
jgi:hypothetical protein